MCWQCPFDLPMRDNNFTKNEITTTNTAVSTVFNMKTSSVVCTVVCTKVNTIASMTTSITQ